MWGQIYSHAVLLIFANIILKASCKGSGSLTFLIDSTSSMTDDIDQVRTSVDRIKEIVLNETSSLIDNMVLVTFNDPGVHDLIATNDTDEFKNKLYGIEAKNEQHYPYLDCWEPAMKGLLLALEKSNNNSYIFVFTDASAKDYIDSQSVIEMCQQKQTQIIFVLTGTLCAKKNFAPAAMDCYFDIAAACSGLAFIVQKKEVDKVFGPIEEMIKGNKTVITTATVIGNDSKDITFKVDGYTDYVIVYASGKNVSVKIKQRSISQKVIMSTDNVKAIKLTNITPGSYVATVKGSKRTSVVIVGRTDFFFNHGFSEIKPKSLKDTSPQPTSEDTKVYLSISVTDDKHSVEIVSAQFYDMDEKPIQTKLPLTEVSKNFYITDPFIAPSQRFKVAINGRVKATGKHINRVSKIPVTPPPPKMAPKVKGVSLVKATKGETTQLECKVVQGFPAPKITWLFGDKSGSNFTQIPKVSDSVLVIKNVNDTHDGKYKCVAENGKGKDEHVQTLKIQDRPKIVSSTSTVYEGTEGDAVLKIPCAATGLPKPSIKWKLKSRVISQNDRPKYSIENGTLIISNLMLSDTNSYTCEAKNDVGADSATFTTSVRRTQTPKLSGDAEKQVRIGFSASIECKVIQGEPKPTITWQFMDDSSTHFVTIAGSDKVLHYIEKAENKHSGRYKCVANNRAGSDEHITILEVQDKPKIVSSVATTYDSTEGEALLKIPCVTENLPKPTITWKLRGRVIIRNAKYSFEDGTLIIRDPTVNDTDSYTCEAVNKLGSVSATFKTNIRQKPKLSGHAVMQGIIGSRASVECKVVKGKPKPTITWQFMDKSSAKFVVISGSDTVHHISRVENKHAGRYKCVANNSVGSAEHVTTLEVQDLPKIVSNFSTTYQSTEEDAFLRIPCAAAGLPKPSITWKLDGRVIKQSTKYSIENGTLIIRAPTVSDPKSYTCEAKNKAGVDRATFKTDIRQAPQLSGVPTEKVRKGSPASIKCTVMKGEPKPTMTWQFMGDSSTNFVTIAGSNKVLHNIEKAENKHSGRYKCVAINSAGSDEHITTLEVQDLPKIVSNFSTTYQSTEGDAFLRIPCAAAGLPKPSITWKLDGRVIKQSAKYSIENGTLIIRTPKVSDTKSYTCEAKNEAGVDRATFKTDIRQAPQLSGVPTEKVRKGSPASIKCTVKGEPKPTITWQFMGNSNSKFIPIPGSNEVLPISKVENTHAGFYKCVANNSVGSAEHVTTLEVQDLPRITINTTTIEGILGDLAMRIPCNVDGVPQPVITWKRNGSTVTPDEKYLIEDGALVIVNPAESDSTSYTCEAKNSVGSDSATFQAAVRYHPKSFGTEHYVYLKQGETRKLECEAYTSESQSVKWFKTKEDSSLSTTSSPPTDTTTPSSSDEGSSTTPQTFDARNKKPYFEITNASFSDHDGKYTCHVSDKHGNTQTHTYVVDVGVAPKFITEDNSLRNWRGDITDIIQYCDSQSNAKPIPKVEWSFNGKVLTDLNSAGLGYYACNVSNVHGSILKQFDVTSSVCLISRKYAPYMPLVLNDEGFWHKLKTTDYYIIIEKGHKITLSCPSQKETSNTFKNFPKTSSLEAKCYKEDSFIVDDKTYKFSELQCTDSIQPSVNKKKVKCSTETSEIISVGYNVPGFLEAYEVCFDHNINMPLYTRIIMSETNKNGPSTGYNWYTYPGIGNAKTERGFTCKVASSSCCYSKSQLVNAIDFNDGPAKKSTFIDPLNVIPVWLPCNTSKPSWEAINNDMVRTKLDVHPEIIVWSGTHTLQEKNGTAIPRYLWKVVRLDDEEVMAIVYVNDPNPTQSDIKCPDICDTYKDWIVSDNSTYCCSLPDFLKSFDFHDTDIGESWDSALDKMKKLPD